MLKKKKYFFLSIVTELERATCNECKKTSIEIGMRFHLRGCDAWPTQFQADCWVAEHPSCQYTAKKKTNEHQQLKSFVVKFEFRHQLMNQRRLERNELIINEIYFHQLMAIGVETKAASSFLFFLCHVSDEDGKAAATLHTKIN